MDIEYILTLMQLSKVGRKTINKILTYINCIPSSNVEIRELLIEAKKNVRRLRIPELEEIKVAREKAYKIEKECEKQNIKVITVLNENFPKKLKSIDNSPVLLFYKGNFQCISEDESIAIIGSREATDHGKIVSERLGSIFGKEKAVIVTGLALGCDEYAHVGSLKVKGRNIAVLPCGLDNVYPLQNKNLSEKILENEGCLLSEYSLKVNPFKNYFIERDRLQSALSRVVVVVETTKNGGTMHTANFAIEQNKSLYCYVHPLKYSKYPQTEGNRELLIHEKAKPLRDEKDIKTIKKLLLDDDIKYKEIDSGKSIEQISMSF